MKKVLLALLLLVGAAAMVANSAFAQTEGDVPNKLVNAKMLRELMQSRAARPNVSAANVDPETVYVGHSYDGLHWNATTNYWNIYTGIYSPGNATTTNALWDWDNSAGLTANGIGDSLAGWWPIRRIFGTTGGLTLPDVSRPWWAIDLGNQANYVMNQGPGGKRTFGVVGVWHQDPGTVLDGNNGIGWTPLSGTKSAWMGLRQHGDNTVMDPLTKNPFNQTVLEYNQEGLSTTGITTKHFPGYGSQMDQILYRDLAPAAGQDLAISFLYRTRMSTSTSSTASSKCGWFHGDPLRTPSLNDGNFISASDAGAAAPIDSFMVYVGVPVNEDSCRYSDNTWAAVYDPQRRWFSEVLRIFEGPTVPYYEIFSAFGLNPADTLSSTPIVAVTVPFANVDAMRDAPRNYNHRVRLVFRVKTNTGFDDASGSFASRGRGAAMVDSVAVGTTYAGATVIGDFEGTEQGGGNPVMAEQIDNRTGSSPLFNWKSTGKPPTVFFHLRSLSELVYHDLCGNYDSPARYCNIGGTVLSAGSFDTGETSGDPRYLVDKEAWHCIVSPTINMVTDQINNTPNAQGLTSTLVEVLDDYILFYDMYAGIFNLNFSGNAWVFGAQCYPATQSLNGAQCWSNLLTPGYNIFNPEPQCFTDFEYLTYTGANPCIITSNPSGIPDSLRVLLSMHLQCFRFGVTLACNSDQGAYFDNATVAFSDWVPGNQVASSAQSTTVGSSSVSIWDLYNDAFPAKETGGIAGTSGFDTLTALVKSGRNVAPATGSMLALDVAADSALVSASNVGVAAPDTDPSTRMDLVFRILPGPGNYDIATGRTFPPNSTMMLLNSPTVQSVAPAAGSFWYEYMADPGPFASPNGHHLDGTVGTTWDYLAWNSARMDTTERNYLPVVGNIGSSLTAGSYMTCYHESDAHVDIAKLGKNKFKCFVVNPAASAVQTNIICDGTVPAWVLVAGTGYDGNNQTTEFTKIIPDGLLTPGSHVQYFFRKSAVTGLGSPNFAACPDTNVVSPQPKEGPSTDGHRWQSFSVLPDNWKNTTYGGAGMACMLYVDWDDRRGDERVWASVMDSIGGTAASKKGANTGWSAAGNVSVNDAAGFVRARNSQPGTTWDMYGVKASESLTTGAHHPGNRYANRTGMGLLTGKEVKSGPTKEMLRTYYHVVALVSGDLNSAIMGPFVNRSSDDLTLMQDFLFTTSGTAQPRGLLVSGDGFAQAEKQTAGVNFAHNDFMTNYLGMDLRAPSYQSLSGNLSDCADLLATPAITTHGQSPLDTLDVYGVNNTCLWSNDVIKRNPLLAVGETQDASFYEPIGINAPYTASVLHNANIPNSRNWIALTEAFDMRHLLGRYCDTSNGRLAYYFNMLNKVFGGMCTLTGSAITTLDTPTNDHGGKYATFMRIGNSVMRPGNSKATITFGVPSSDRVKVRLYDVTGRQVRSLADRTFQAGENTLTWDGSDDSGNQVARGVYFARIVYATKGAPINGRVVVLR